MACCKSNVPFMCIILTGIAVIIAGVALNNASGRDAKSSTRSDSNEEPTGLLDFEMQRIDGRLESLDVYKGKVVLIVNVASECGLTPQYEALEALYQHKQDEGLVILAFPANNFGGQEPGTDEEIAQFCTASFNVTFPMFSKISVAGEDAHPFYKHLDALPDPVGDPPNWNFTKYLVDRNGKAVARFEPQTTPGDPSLVAAIDAQLAEPAQ